MNFNLSLSLAYINEFDFVQAFVVGRGVLGGTNVLLPVPPFCSFSNGKYYTM